MKKEFQLPTGEGKAMEGRLIKPDGADAKDAHFHEEGWGTSPSAAEEDLERMADSAVELEEDQAEMIAAVSVPSGIRAFEGLIAMHPSHPRVSKWKKTLADLEAKK